ncbi:hypothetical protein [Cellulomonas sp. URHE0023]|uniref:hypothetical protein n=1 Tax=Cellulomonas sp. URHE0023 TaxID=1380354 RepID=UPI0006911969|nr:hypothetical protein [Cellulomonas sp. URHE0023]
MPRRSTPLAHAAALAATAATLLCATGCTTSTPSAPASTGPTTVVASPSPTESLLPGTESTHSAVGEVVEGFPADLIPVPAGAEVLVSSAEPVVGTDLTAVSLNLSSDQDSAGLLAAVSAPLVAAGFVAGTPPVVEPALAAQATFSRGDGSELLVVGILDRDGARTMTLGGRVRTASP